MTKTDVEQGRCGIPQSRRMQSSLSPYLERGQDAGSWRQGVDIIGVAGMSTDLVEGEQMRG
jgi:hypothetical protein